MRQISNLFIASLALFLLVAEPALAQSIDLSPIQSLLQGIVDALTGPLGVVSATLAVLGVFLSWFFNIIDLRQALLVLVGIAGVAAADYLRQSILDPDAFIVPGYESGQMVGGWSELLTAAQIDSLVEYLQGL